MNEAELLFSELLRCDRASLYLNKGLFIPPEKSRQISCALGRRIRGEPLQYILGNTEFMGLEFKIGKGVLIPRPETEHLVEAAMKYLRITKKLSNPGILDLGTGSGCIAVSLLKLLPSSKVDASDISVEALRVARKNAALQGVRVNFIESDLFSSKKIKLRHYDLIISNPPYIPTAQIKKLQIELSYEPKVALDGGSDGLDFYRKIIFEAPRYLKKRGLLIMEMGFKQDEKIENIFHKSAKFEIIEIARDLNNINRVVVAQKIN
jgi:release factor glutamine methyltransferase